MGLRVLFTIWGKIAAAEIEYIQEVVFKLPRARKNQKKWRITRAKNMRSMIAAIKANDQVMMSATTTMILRGFICGGGGGGGGGGGCKKSRRLRGEIDGNVIGVC